MNNLGSIRLFGGKELDVETERDLKTIFTLKGDVVLRTYFNQKGKVGALKEVFRFHLLVLGPLS